MAAPTQSDIDRLAAVPVAAGKLLIDGKWLEGEAGETVVLSPINGQKLTTTAAASPPMWRGRWPRPGRSFESGVWIADGRLLGARRCCTVWPI